MPVFICFERHNSTKWDGYHLFYNLFLIATFSFNAMFHCHHLSSICVVAFLLASSAINIIIVISIIFTFILMTELEPLEQTDGQSNSTPVYPSTSEASNIDFHSIARHQIVSVSGKQIPLRIKTKSSLHNCISC